MFFNHFRANLLLLLFHPPTATIVWAPEITGELICSLLGTPIVIVGIVLFTAAHLTDCRERHQRRYASLMQHHRANAS